VEASLDALNGQERDEPRMAPTHHWIMSPRLGFFVTQSDLTGLGNREEKLIMGVADQFDNMKNKAEDMMGTDEERDDKVDSAAEKADRATGGKMSGKIDKGSDMAKDGMDKLDQ